MNRGPTRTHVGGATARFLLLVAMEEQEFDARGFCWRGLPIFRRSKPMSAQPDDKKRRDPRTGSDSEPHIPDVDPAELEDDQADSGPDRDHKELEG